MSDEGNGAGLPGGQLCCFLFCSGGKKPIILRRAYLNGTTIYCLGTCIFLHLYFLLVSFLDNIKQWYSHNIHSFLTKTTWRHTMLYSPPPDSHKGTSRMISKQHSFQRVQNAYATISHSRWIHWLVGFLGGGWLRLFELLAVHQFCCI